MPTGKNKSIIGLKKDELGGKFMKEFAAPRPKTFSYLMDDGNTDKKTKEAKNCVIKRILKFNNYNNCILTNEIILKPQQSFRSEAHLKVNKTALSSNDDKRLQTYGRITSYPYHSSAGKVCKTEKLSKVNIND